MYKNVQVNHYNNATSTTATAPTFSSSSSFPFETNQTSTSLPVQITSASSSSFSSSTPITRLPSLPNSNIGVSKVGDGGISLPVSFSSTKENMSLSQTAKLKSDVDQLDDLVKDLLIEVNRPIGTSTNNRISNNTNTNNKYSTSSSSHSYQHRSNNDHNEILNAKLPSSIRASSYTQASTLNNQKRNDFDANTVSGLIDGSSLSSSGAQREEQRIKTTREERIRVKRSGGGGGGGISDTSDIPITNSTMKTTTTTTTTNKPSQTAASRDQLSIDEQLIDSLLESVQNTLRKRSQQQTQQTVWTADIPVHQQPPPTTSNRRTYSSSAAYTDSVHRMDPNRGRYPIKLVRTDSPTSTLSSRRPYSRQDNRGNGKTNGYTTTVTSTSTSAIPTHFRASSEPAPDGPIELRRMDLVRSPSRTYIDGQPTECYNYSRSTLPANGIRVRGHDYSGYETDTGLVTSRGYGPRYYGGPPPPPLHVPPAMPYPYYPAGVAAAPHLLRERHHETYSATSSGGGHRTMLRPDGYDTDSGLISSGRLRMTRTLPPRMAVIPETLVVNNRMVSSSNLNNVPTNLRGSSFLNESNTNTLRSRADNLTGYETDSGMRIRQQNYSRHQVPIDIQYGDSGWVGKQSMARPTSQQQQQQQQQQRFIDNNQRYRSQDQLRSTSIPVVTQDSSATITRLPGQHITLTNRAQQKRTLTALPSSSTTTTTTTTTKANENMETMRKHISILPNFFPGSVGLSNPPSTNKQQIPASPELKRKFSDDNTVQMPSRVQCSVIETTILPVSNESNAEKPQVFSTTAEIIPTVNSDRFEHQTTSKTPATPTFPVTNQTYNQNIQPRVGNSSFRNQEENSRRSSVSSATESDVNRNGAYQAHHVSQYWYKEKMSREDAINLLKTKPPGTFLVRDSQGFPGSYGLAIKVETLPPGIQAKQGADPNAELVRHYLIERTSTGHVRLKGCPNEPDFANLSVLVYQHSITPLALPIKLVLPTFDITEDYRSVSNQQQQQQQQQQHETLKKMSVKDLLEKGAACNVVYLNNVDVESLSGQMAVNKALRATFENFDRLQATIVHFKVSNTGITLTDTKKKLFSRRHFPKEYVTYCGVDYETDRYWIYQFPDLEMLPKAKCFGFVSKKINGNNRSNQPENECHIFAEIDRTQPSTAIVNFVSKVMIGSVPV
ncbi:unnamed protein product [Rotaria socialis]|uniref:SH2 domain-containing protein n=2 Tax=Rotaria socialis TaxID=392032 RepID=A0A820P5S1_9BILA|nr:unnamed protein product [Rotaria socialis]